MMNISDVMDTIAQTLLKNIFLSSFKEEGSSQFDCIIILYVCYIIIIITYNIILL